MKYEPTNGILLCPHHHDRAEADPDPFLADLKAKWPAAYSAYLSNVRSLQGPQKPVRTAELKEATEELRALFNKLTKETK